MMSIASLLGPPAFLLFSIPLALFAAFTTTLAISLLFIRVSVIYLELGVALIHSWLVGRSSKPLTLPERRRSGPSRRGSAASTNSQDLNAVRRAPRKSESSASLFVGTPNRDYEGVGGWRLFGDGEEEAIWIGLNSRLELPASIGERPRNHQRSLTGGSQRLGWSPGAMRRSPVQSRVRTPTGILEPGAPEGYFGYQPHDRMTSSGTTRGKGDSHRKSPSSSSSGSAGSTLGSSRVTIKHVGHA